MSCNLICLRSLIKGKESRGMNGGDEIWVDAVRAAREQQSRDIPGLASSRGSSFLIFVDGWSEKLYITV